MAVGLANQSAVARGGQFQELARAAIVGSATLIYNEATTLTANIKTGTPNATLTVTPGLGVALAPNTAIRVGAELLMCTAGAAQNATSIATTTTAAQDHFVGEPVGPPSVVNHWLRASYARQVLNNPDQFVIAWAAALASQGLDDSSTDTAINTGVASLWNAMAGA